MTPVKENPLREQGAYATNHTANYTRPGSIKQSAKRLIVRAALWGALPTGVASWLLHRLGLVSE